MLYPKRSTSAVVLAGAVLSAPALAQQLPMLTGDPKLACEAIMCLSSGSPPHECQPALNRFFSINLSRPERTVAERMRFLNQCPIQVGPTGQQSGDGSKQ